MDYNCSPHGSPPLFAEAVSSNRPGASGTRSPSGCQGMTSNSPIRIAIHCGDLLSFSLVRDKSPSRMCFIFRASSLESPFACGAARGNSSTCIEEKVKKNNITREAESTC